MRKMTVFIALVALILSSVVFAETIPVQQPKKPDFQYTTPQRSFFEWINSKAFIKKIDKGEDKKMARRVWKKSLGVDVFYPYFQVKKAKNLIEDKTKVNVLSMHGKARIHDNEIKYIFKREF